jgi:hypothetical protein
MALFTVAVMRIGRNERLGRDIIYSLWCVVLVICVHYLHISMEGIIWIELAMHHNAHTVSLVFY